MVLVSDSHRCAQINENPRCLSPRCRDLPNGRANSPSSTMPSRSSVAQTRSATLAMSAGDRKYSTSESTMRSNILVRPFVRHPHLLEANPWLISTRLACGRQRRIDDVHRQQSVTAFCQQPGQHTDRATRLEARAKRRSPRLAIVLPVFRLLICARAELPRVRTCIIETLEMRGIARLTIVAHGSRNVSHGVSNAATACGQLKSTRIVGDQSAIL